MEADLPGETAFAADLLGPVDGLLGELTGGHEASGHQLRFGHPAENRRQGRPARHAGALVEATQELQPLVDAPVVGQQPTDQVFAVRGAAHRREARPRAGVQSLEALQMDAQAGVELCLDQCRVHLEDHLGVGVRDLVDRLESAASSVQLAGDVVVGDPGEELEHFCLEQRVSAASAAAWTPCSTARSSEPERRTTYIRWKRAPARSTPAGRLATNDSSSATAPGASPALCRSRP